MNQKNKSEIGQITVLMVVAMVAFLGAATLSIDGGMLFLERREAQSAADNAAMAGVLALTRGYTGPDIQTIVLERATANGFDNSSEEVEVQVYSPPIAPNPYAGNPDYVQVIITSRIHSAFIHFIYAGALEVTVEAVAHAEPRNELAAGYALFGLNETACQTIWFTGNPDLHVVGRGNVGSNSVNGCDCGSLVTSGTFVAEIQGGGNFTIAQNGTGAGCWVNNSGPGSISPLPVLSVPQVSKHRFEELVPEPKCSTSVQPGENINNTTTINPGTYEYLKVRAQGDVTMNPGLYCISGSLDGWGLEVKGGGSLFGDGVTIYLMDSAGGLKTAGTSIVNLTAPDDYTNPWAGMVINSHPDNTNDIILTGTSGSLYVGTVLAIGSHCDVEGTSGVSYSGQVICDTIRVNGNGELNISYDAGVNYVHPANVDLAQ
jgi:hypothetical protein